MKTPIYKMRVISKVTAWALLGFVAVALSGGCSKSNAAAPLINAVCEGNTEECARLVKDGLPVDAMDADGDTALDWAVFCCKPNIVRKLVELGANVNHVDQRGGFTPLMYTATTLRGHFLRGTEEQRNEIAQLLIQHGADVNHSMGDGSALGSGQTTLHFAAEDKNAGLIRLLLAAGANRNTRSNQGYTPLDVAKFPDYAPNDEVIKLLQQPTTQMGQDGK